MYTPSRLAYVKDSPLLPPHHINDVRVALNGLWSILVACRAPFVVEPKIQLAHNHVGLIVTLRRPLPLLVVSATKRFWEIDNNAALRQSTL